MINLTSSQDSSLVCPDKVDPRGASILKSLTHHFGAPHETQWPMPLLLARAEGESISRPLAPASQKREESEKSRKWVLKVEQTSSLSVSYLLLSSVWHSIGTFTALFSALLRLQDCICWVSQTGKPAPCMKGPPNSREAVSQPSSQGCCPFLRITTNGNILPGRHKSA